MSTNTFTTKVARELTNDPAFHTLLRSVIDEALNDLILDANAALIEAKLAQAFPELGDLPFDELLPLSELDLGESLVFQALSELHQRRVGRVALNFVEACGRDGEQSLGVHESSPSGGGDGAATPSPVVPTVGENAAACGSFPPCCCAGCGCGSGALDSRCAGPGTNRGDAA